ncbi:MAG: hypothetical protein QXY40_05710 [Candidatus Methanomethylicia archaeon]
MDGCLQPRPAKIKESRYMKYVCVDLGKSKCRDVVVDEDMLIEEFV